MTYRSKEREKKKEKATYEYHETRIFIMKGSVIHTKHNFRGACCHRILWIPEKKKRIQKQLQKSIEESPSTGPSSKHKGASSLIPLATDCENIHWKKHCMFPLHHCICTILKLLPQVSPIDHYQTQDIT